MLCKVNTPLIYTHTRSFICFSDWSKSEAEEIPTRLFPSTLPTLSLTLSSAKLKQQLSQNPIVFHASWAACIPHTVRTLSLSKKLCLYKSSALKESLDYILNMYFRGYALSSSPENESLLTHPCCFKPTWLFFPIEHKRIYLKCVRYRQKYVWTTFMMLLKLWSIVIALKRKTTST